VVKSKRDEMDDYIQFLIHQEIPKTVLQGYQRTEMELPQRARRDSSFKQPVKLTPMKIEKVEFKKPKMVEISSVVEFPQMLKLKAPKQRPQEEKKRKNEASFKNKRLKSWIRFIPYAPYCFPYVVTELETNRDVGELSRNVEEAEKVLKLRPRKFKPSKPEKTELEEADLEPFDSENSEPSDKEQPRPKYKRTKKLKDEVPEETRKLKLGKGKIPQNVEAVEEIRLKPVELGIAEEEVGEKPVKMVGEEVIKKKKTKKSDKPEDGLYFEPIDFKDVESSFEFPEESETSATEETFTQGKPKYKRKKKPTSKPEKNQYEIAPGKPKEQEEIPEDELKLHKRQGEKPDTEEEKFKLKPFYKFEVIEMEPENVPSETLPTTEKLSKEPKKKRKLKLKTEQEDNTIEIVEISPEGNDDKI